MSTTSDGRWLSFFFLAALFVATFEKLHWEVGATVRLADVASLLFVVAFAWDRLRNADTSFPRTVAVLAAFLAAFLLVYLGGFFNLGTKQATTQFGKGVVTWAIHFAFLVAAVAYLARRGERAYWQALRWFVAGVTCNAAYGLLQLVDAKRGGNLDHTLLSPLTHGASSINIYGAVNGSSVYRPNALTGDPNHLAIVLLVPLLVLLPVYLRLERGHRRRVPLAILLGFLFVMELATLSRSGMVGLIAGLLVLVVPYRRFLVSRQLAGLAGGIAAVVGVVVLSRLSYFEQVLRSRLHTGSRGTSAHFGVYDFIPQVLHMHPALGLGFNTFSVYYEFSTGKTDWGPHSFYVALFVETGIVGAAVFAVFLWYVFRRLRFTRDLGRALGQLGDPLSSRVRPLGYGLTAALVATMAANAFYLTMTFDYFFAFAALVLATPLVFANRLRVPSLSR